MGDKELSSQTSPTDIGQGPIDDPIRGQPDIPIVLAMIDKAFLAEQEAARSRDNAAFRYIAALIAIFVAVLSEGLQVTGVTGKLFVTIAALVLILLATLDILIKQRQTQDLTRVLVHLENTVGCYTPDKFVKNHTLLPKQWLERGDYIGNTIVYARISMLWLLAAIGCVALWIL